MLRVVALCWEAAVVSIDDFRQGLVEQMDRAAYGGRIDVLINSGELYRSLGGHPGTGCIHAATQCRLK
jgi:hypothetical protein